MRRDSAAVVVSRGRERLVTGRAARWCTCCGSSHILLPG